MLLGAYHEFRIRCADSPVTVELYDVGGPTPTLISTQSGTSFDVGIPLTLGGADFAIRVEGPVGRYRFQDDQGVDRGWLDKWSEFHRFIPPHVLVSDVLVDPFVDYAVFARDAVEHGIVVHGEGLRVEVYDMRLQLVGRGEPSREGATVVFPEGEFEDEEGLFVVLRNQSGAGVDVPFAIQVGDAR